MSAEKELPLITCPTCGHPVAENQRFCGNCGTDVQAAAAYRSSSSQPAASTQPGSSNQPYGYEQGAYDYPTEERRPTQAMLALIVAGVAILCLCCGLLLGALGMYWFGPVPAPAPLPTPTPEGLNLFRTLLAI